jgi:VTC domain
MMSLPIEAFAPVGLDQLGKADLMSRVDRKYYFPLHFLPNILNAIQDDYLMLEVNGVRLNTYKTLYFDTEKLDCFVQHHRGNGHRYKVRHRTYVESKLGFLEVKLKNNKGRTIKDRIRLLEPQLLMGQSSEFVESKTPFHTSDLRPSIWVEYQRLTLVGKHHPERVTLDLHLTFSNETQKKSFPDIVIAEVKQDRQGTSPFVKLMQKHHLRPGGISKYCFGIMSLFPDIKSNHFKNKLHLLKKTTHGFIANR